MQAVLDTLELLYTEASRDTEREDEREYAVGSPWPPVLSHEYIFSKLVGSPDLASCVNQICETSYLSPGPWDVIPLLEGVFPPRLELRASHVRVILPE